MNKKPILVATDLSARSDRAIDRALILGEQLGRRLCLVHAVTAIPGGTVDKAALETRVRSVLPDPTMDIEIALPIGSAPQAIADTAARIGAEMIVSGVARCNSIGDYMIGTAVDHVIREGHLPVLVVKRRPHIPYGKLLVTTDFSDAAKRGLVVAAEMFPDAEIHTLMAYHVAYEGWQSDEHLRDEAKERREGEMDLFLADPDVVAALAGRIVTPHLSYGDIGQVLIDLIAEMDPDLIVAGTEGAGGLKRFAFGSVASSMLEWVDKDMLVVPPIE